MRKRSLALAMAGALGLSLTGCGSSAATESSAAPAEVSGTAQETSAETGENAGTGETLTLRFSWWGGDARHEAILEAIDTYEASHEGIVIEPEYSSFAGYYEKLVTQLASGNAPDIFQVDQGWVAELYARGDAFADISAYEDVMDLEAFPEDMMEDYCRMDGQVIALPMGYNGTVFLYNKDLLADWCDEDGNLEMETWDDFMRIGRELHEKDGESYMTTAVTDGYLRYILKPMLEQITGEIDVKDDLTLGFDAAQLAQAYDSFTEIFTENVSQPYEEAVLYDSMQNNPLWLNGKIGGIFLFFSNIDTEISGLDYNFGVAGMPMFEGAEVSGQESAPSLMAAINQKSDEAHQKAAAEFLEWFLNSEEAAKILGTVCGVPASNTALTALEENDMLSPLMAEGIQISEETKSLKNGAYEMNSSVKAVFVEYMEKVIYGVSSSEEAAAEMIEDLQSVLADMGGAKES